jgi:hypothetical protein
MPFSCRIAWPTAPGKHLYQRIISLPSDRVRTSFRRSRPLTAPNIAMLPISELGHGVLQDVMFPSQLATLNTVSSDRRN